MGKQLSFYLDETAYRKLYAVSRAECRRPRDHVRYIILSSLGLFTDDGSGPAKINNRHDAKASTGHSVMAVAEITHS